MNRTWFISPEDAQVVLVEHPISNGATDGQWRALIRMTGVRIKNDNRKWGALSRCQFLNWLESKYPDRMPAFFDSKEAAESELANRKTPSNIEENKSEESN